MSAQPAELSCPKCPRTGFASARGVNVHGRRTHQPGWVDIPEPGRAPRAPRSAAASNFGVHPSVLDSVLGEPTEHDNGIAYYTWPLILDATTSARLELLAAAHGRNAAEILRDHVDALWATLDVGEHPASTSSNDLLRRNDDHKPD